MATITLKYQKNQSHEIRVEDLKIGKVNNKWTVKEEASTASFFMEEYKEAIEMVNAIIALCDSKKEDGKRNGSTKNESESINNRILFVGQRGTGKTSAMTSFSKGLDDAEIEGLDDAEIDNHKALYFKRLPMIDPSNFDNNTNILLTVITMMFSEAKELMKENGNNEDIISTRESLLKQFDEAFKSLKAITGSDRPTFTLEGLNEKSRALQMRTGMHNLVKRYIEFYNKTRKTNIRYLVLLIDDIDMTVSHVPEMLEQLRKYLDLDNLLIFMSANLGQLYNEMREHYSKAFKETLNDRNQALSIDVEDLANKYLLKLFPTSRRIRVEHSVKQLLNTRLEINDAGIEKTRTFFSNADGSFRGSYKKENDKYSVNFEINDGRVNGETDTIKNEPIKGDLQNVVLSLIWQKTRLLFIPKDANTMLHPLIPTNLRELMQFLDMLTLLEEVSNIGEDGKPKLFGNFKALEKCEENVRKFKKYILHNWIPNHLSVEEELVFEHIPTDITEINKHLINSINVIGNQHRRELMSREVGLDMIERNAEDVNIDRDIYTMVSLNDPKFVKANKISDIFNQPSNYSYGDLLLMIDKYETYFESEDNRKFTDAIKVYYSILLFETMFFGSKDVIYEKGKLPQDAELEDLLIPIQKLIGGTVYYPNYFEIITDKHFNQKGPSFDAKRAFYHKLPVYKDKNVGENYPFYAVLYYGDIRPDRYDTNHIYDTTFKNNAKIEETDYVTFDILSILSNMLNPWHTYRRAEEKKINEFQKWGKKINNWSSNCEIPKKGNDGVIKEYKRIPNSILPFYSVDIMLQYLKHSQPSQKVSGNSYPPNLDEIAKMRDDYSKALFGSRDTTIDTSLWGYFVDKNNNTKGTDKEEEPSVKNSIELYVETKDKQKKLSIRIINNKSDDKTNIASDTFYSFIEKEPIEKKPEIEVLLNNLFIVSKIYVCYKNISICPPLHGVRNTTEPFKNYVMAVLLNHYSGGKKNLNTLMKDLHKCETVSETYRLVVDYLWINSVNEILIRNKIQKSIRDNKSVSRYYVILWSETVRMLEVIAHPVEKDAIQTVSENEWMDYFDSKSHNSSQKKSFKEMKKKLGNSNAIVVYFNLFMEAKKVFIDEEK